MRHKRDVSLEREREREKWISRAIHLQFKWTQREAIHNLIFSSREKSNSSPLSHLYHLLRPNTPPCECVCVSW